MSMILYTSNIYNTILNKNYFNCICIIGLEIYYLYGVLSWNPMIISILMLHSIFTNNNIVYILIKEIYVTDTSISYGMPPEEDLPKSEKDLPEPDPEPIRIQAPESEEETNESWIPEDEDEPKMKFYEQENANESDESEESWLPENMNNTN